MGFYFPKLSGNCMLIEVSNHLNLINSQASRMLDYSLTSSVQLDWIKYILTRLEDSALLEKEQGPCHLPTMHDSLYGPCTDSLLPFLFTIIQLNRTLYL
jgi:hypothetical protein